MTVADYISRPESQSRQNLPQQENHAEPKVPAGRVPSPFTPVEPQSADQPPHRVSPQENGTSAKKDEQTPSKRSPSKGVSSAGDNLTLVNGVS